MLTRRQVLSTLVAYSCTAGRAARAAASQPSTPVSFSVPRGTCDSHTHIIGDPARFPFDPQRPYTPEPATPPEMSALHRQLHVQRVVIVTPVCYGHDNSATIDGMKARGRDARGIALIDDSTSSQELQRLQRLGFRGLRLNMATQGITDPQQGRALLSTALLRAREIGWQVQINTSLAMVVALADLVRAAAVPVVFDHFGGANPQQDPQQPGYPELLSLVRAGRSFVKITVSAGTRSDYSGFGPLVQALLAADARRVVWGTNWPHPHPAALPGHKATDVTPLYPVDDGRVFNELPMWVPDEPTRHRILVDNPAQLYGF